MRSEIQAPSYPSLGRARFAQVVLACIGLIAAMDAAIVALLIEPMKHELHLTDVQIGLANTTVFYLGYGLLSAPMGMLVDRINRTRLLLVAIVLWCASLAMVALSHDLWLLMLGKALMGAANAVTLPAALSLYSDYFAPERRAFATSTYAFGQMVGAAGAILLGGLGFSALAKAVAADPQALLGLSAWRAVFLLFAAGALALVPCLIAMREPARQEVARPEGGNFRELWSYRGFLLPLYVGLMCLIGLSTEIITWTTPALMRLYHLKPGDFAGWYSAVQLGAGLVGVIVAGRVTELARRRAGRSGVMVPAALAALICAPASCLALAPSVFWFAVGLGLFGFANAVALTVPIIAINFRIPNELRGLSMGLNVVFVALAGAISSPLVAKISDLMGGEAMLGRAMAGVGVPLALLTAFCFWMASRSHAVSVDAPQPVSNAPEPALS